MFVGLVVVHEFGHFIAARRSGVEVEEFGIGFPPRAKIISKRSGTIYSINWLPLGGFVKLKGENDADTEPGTYGAASLSQKVRIMSAGVVMNLLTSFLLFSILAFVGMPKLIDNQFSVPADTVVGKQSVLVGYTEPSSPAAKAGIQLEDAVISINGQSVTSQDRLKALTKQFAGQKVIVIVKRHGHPAEVTVTLRSSEEVAASQKSVTPKGYLGVSPTQYTLQRSTWSAPVVAIGLMSQLTGMTFKALGSTVVNLFHGHTSAALAQVSGPVGIFVLLKSGSLIGFQFVLFILAYISLTLAIINVLPIPALDGGRLFVTLIFRALKWPLTKKTEDTIHGTGFLVLMVLVVLLTIVDVKRFF